MKYFRLIFPFILVCLSAIVWSCSDDDSVIESTEIFDRQAMLANWSDNIIIPAYQAFSTEVDALKSAVEAFETQPNEANLNTVRQEWEAAYIAWQNIAMFNIGPAETTFMRSFINTYPANVSSINTNISTGDYALQAANANDEQGFPALDYLLFGLADSDAQILEFYTSNVNSSKYITYLTELVNRINVIANQVVASWEGDYRDTFVNNSGAASNSSTNKLLNDWMFYYEVVFRNGKIGFPAGVFSEGSTLPQNVEAFYKKDLSKTLCLEALNAFQDFFNGEAFEGTTRGESLASYLHFLNTMKNGEDLSRIINNQFDLSRTAMSNLDDNFFNQINTNNNVMLVAFEELQASVVLLKSDMFSALSVAVEFESGDGD
ncbi:imelysin family protein [Maribacter antarcticus]|uniref:imelysin family protein n=1 Tax=Maribacter antarcticus TaxID=505250 RepID=UPI00047B9D4E|nr:imelysin family protein [Maribacter antarcticus]